MTDKLIIALDVPTTVEARSIVSELKDQVAAFKIGLQLFTSAGPSFVRELTNTGVRIFLDLKFHDIPNTVASAAVEAARLGVWMFNVHCLGGGEMIRRTVEEVSGACERQDLVRPLVIGVTILTSSNSETLRDVGIDGDVEREVVVLALLAAKNGLDGVVASPHEIAAVRSSVGPEFVIVTPGIRPVFATNDDQTRVMTPAEALAAGSDYIVVGRPVIQAADRAEAVHSIKQGLIH